MNTTASIVGISRHRISIDGKGVTTLVAFAGCPLRCRYCLNPHSWNGKAEVHSFTPQQLYEYVKLDQLYFLATGGGLTFGGGEPLLQPDFIADFRSVCGDDWNLTLETSLNVPLPNWKKLLPVVNDYIVDIKDMNPQIYQRYTGKDNEMVIQNLQFLLDHVGAEHVLVRVPHIPDYNTDEDVRKSREKLMSMGVTRIDEFTYRTDL